ncbi:MAG: AAA family ATPase [Candidatus Lokiarchaeota archaeon]|nr:AAA family ATPase [Candidatus Harpocratesius repetitus]
MSKSDEISESISHISTISNVDKEKKVSISEKSLSSSPIIFVEKIVLQNFLSFEYDEVLFDPQFSIIIGPNGAGKSSIYQALKFVLGSNDYDGRYSKWSDFIRTGAKKAVVQIHIFIDKEEYILQRIVSMNETPKFLFKSPKDKKLRTISVKKVKDFTKQIQIDPNNIFAFMSQGNIDTIKDFKEETLCSFIENGLGLNLTREQILEVKSEIFRLKQEENSLLTERENILNQLTELEPLIEQLKKKDELKSHLDKLQLELIIAQKSQIEEEIERLQNKILIISKEIQSFNKQINGFSEDISNYENEKEKETKFYNELIEQRTKLQMKNEHIKQQIEDWTDEKNNIATQIQSLEHEIETQIKQKKQISSEMVLSESKIKSTEIQLSKHQKQIQNLQTIQTQLQNQMQQYKYTINQLDAEEQVLNILTASMDEYQADYDNFTKEIDQRLREINKIKNEFRKYQWFLKNPTDNLPDLMRQEEHNVLQRISVLTKNLSDLQEIYNENIKSIEKINNSIIDRNFPKPRQIQALLDELKERNLNFIGPLIDYITYDELYRSAVESIFGFSVLFSFIAKDSETFHLLTTLAKKHGAKCKIYKERTNQIRPLPNLKPDPTSGIFGYLAEKIKPISEDPAILKVIYSVANKTLVVKDHIIGEQYIERYNWSSWVVTLAGDQIRPKRLVLEALPRISSSQRAKFQNVAQAKKKIAELSNQMKHNRELYLEREQRLEEEKHKLSILKTRLQDVDRLYSNYKLLEIKTTSKNNLVSKKKELFKKIQEKIQDIQEKEKKINSLRQSLPDSFVEQKQQLDEIPLKIAELNEILIELNDMYGNLQKNRENLKENEIKIKIHLEDLEKQKSKLNFELKSKDDKFYSLFQETIKLEKEIHQYQQKEKEKGEKLKDLEEKISNILEKKHEISLKINTLQFKQSQLSQSLEDNTVKLQTIENLLKGSISLNSKRTIDEIEADIQFIQHEIDKIQVDDGILLEKEKLENIIDRIGEKRQSLQNEISAAETSQKRLETTFFKNFQEKINFLQDSTNSKLQFSGQNFTIQMNLKGEIESLKLSVITTTSINNCNVQYPLQAVSGGQRSMVGICLMLSLTHLNPSPLNIYDECDMFLDELNAETIAKLIHQLARNGIQFILLMPSKNIPLLKNANKVIGVSRNGKFGPSFVHYSRAFAHES